MSYPRRRLHPVTWGVWILLVSHGLCAHGQQGSAAPAEQRRGDIEIQPLLTRFCQDCHSQDLAEADIDLSSFRNLDDVRTRLVVWEKVRAMLDGDQMPPPEAPQPTSAEKTQMREWVHRVLAGFAREQAGDPGPVILRRLTNAEYNYTLRDLTGIESLDPTREFPIDGAAGEGFTNVGSGQGMSPSLVHKYLDAAKEVASHIVLLPDGVRFSEKSTRSDQTDELVRGIQEIYRRYTTDGGGTTVNLDGNPLTTNQGGMLPVESYLRATLAERDALRNNEVSLNEIAREHGLSAKYLRTLWTELNDNNSSSGPLLAELRRQWRAATEADAPRLAGHIAEWQSVLWRYNSIGHIGREGGAPAWLEEVSPVVTSHEIRFPLPPGGEDDVTVRLDVRPFFPDGPGGIVTWRQPRLEFPTDAQGRQTSPLLLRDVRQVAARVEQILSDELPRTAEYLDALLLLRSSPDALQQIVVQRRLDPHLLERWGALTGVSLPAPPTITGHFGQKLVQVRGEEDINGWGNPDLPSLLTNRSDEAIRIGTLTVPPRGVTVHPSPALDAAVVWQSPVSAAMNIRGRIADADNNCGNGVSWRLELQTAAGSRSLLTGEFDDGGAQTWELESPLDVATGEVLALLVSARAGDHSCDTTHVELTLSEQTGQQRRWDLAEDAIDSILVSNPLSDRHGHNDVWHFCARQGASGPAAPLVPDSALARWQAAVSSPVQSPQALEELGREVQSVLTARAETLSDADRQLRQQLLSWRGPLEWLALARIPGEPTAQEPSPFGLDPQLFGRRQQEDGVDAADLRVEAPQSVEVRLPSQLAEDAVLVATGVLQSGAGNEAAVQLQVLGREPVGSALPAVPILVQEGTQTARRVHEVLEEFRQLFPPALCYVRIIPVDEVVTLTLYHREDHHLKRLMLEEADAEELDRLWDELRFVSQEPLRLVVAFEQISEFATQDRPDLVEAFAPLRQPILDRAEEFRKEMAAAEASQVDSVIQLAGRAWRRPLTSAQQDDLRNDYRQLRESELPHEDAVRLLMARVLTAPAFLFKLETPAAGAGPAPVSDNELAVRLSYFLWSSLPDDNLRQAAEAGRLSQDDILVAQTRRMLRDTRTRRLAIHFACQWLHVRDFDQLVEKNEQLYPHFTTLRGDMYEETVRFFEDLFRSDGSILDVLQADHTYLNGPLAEHYGLPRPPGEDWQRIEGLREQGRGGILGMASVLASQSGASRTSPILRGTWVSETLLGERLPKPPPGIPTLPETVPQNLTARQLIELHSSAPGCATCHRRIDPYGFALEQFDTVGHARAEGADTRTTLIDGVDIEGLAGLRDYLVHNRREDFVRQFCRKLLGYALGREVQLSDEPLLDEIHGRLKQDGYRFSTAVEAIVTSRPFRDIRGTDHPVPQDPAINR